MATKNGESNLGEVGRETTQVASDAVKSAKAVSKIAANAASGNAAGAVVEGAKAAPELFRTAGRLIVAMLAVILILTYAFPASIYEATSSFLPPSKSARRSISTQAVETFSGIHFSTT